MTEARARPRFSIPLAKTGAIAAVTALLVIGAAGIYLWSKRPQLSREEIRDVVYSTIQSEAPASFLVTGYIDVTAVTRVENTKTVLPGIIGLDLGTNSAEVRVPGRVSYGFDVSEITADMIVVGTDGVVEVSVPDPRIWSIEPNLGQMEIETERGWARISEQTQRDVRDRAIALVQSTMNSQAARYLRESRQPGINTANALYRMLEPALEAAGITDPQFRFRVGRDITIEP